MEGKLYDGRLSGLRLSSETYIRWAIFSCHTLGGTNVCVAKNGGIPMDNWGDFYTYDSPMTRLVE